MSVSAAVHTAFENLTFLRADLHDGVLPLAIGTGVVIWQLLGPLSGSRARRWTVVWSAFLFVVPWLVTATLWSAGSTESGGRSPFRAAFLPVASVALAISLIVWIVLSLYPALLSQTRATLLALTLVALGCVGVAHKADPIITAELMRAHAVSTRAASIRRQLGQGKHTIDLTPAPLLTVFTQALDLSFATPAQERSGLEADLRLYYRIPNADVLKIAQHQPRHYCLPNVAAPWVGAESCQELQADSR